MSNKMIPENAIDPFRYAEQGLIVEGGVKLEDLHRLSLSTVKSEHFIDAKLQFGVDEQHINFVRGNLHAKVPVQCQRCMEPFTYEIICNFILGIVKTLEEANALPEQYEPAVAKEGELALRELIEDEIILNLPIIAKHPPEACKVKLPLTDTGWGEGKGENPFHVLEVLKHKQQ